jgi:hypothetical protein
VSALLHHRNAPRWTSLTQLAGALGIVGGALGVIAGLVELVAGPAIRDLVGDKQDTTRLGIATTVLAMVAFAAARELIHRPAAAAPRRFLLALGLLLPGVVCFTTVGSLWYVPGLLLLVAAALTVAGVWGERRAIAAAVERNWTAALVVALALVYLFLGATALGTAGVLGVAGGLVVLAVVATRGRIPMPLALALLLLAALPFPALTWWSVATPFAGLLLLAIGAPFLARHPRAGDRGGSWPRM